MSDEFSIDENYPIDRVIASLDNAFACAKKEDEAWLSLIKISGDILTDDDKSILVSFMGAIPERSSDDLCIEIKGNNRIPILFNEKRDALLTANQQISNLGKQLVFSIYRKTGVNLSLTI